MLVKFWTRTLLSLSPSEFLNTANSQSCYYLLKVNCKQEQLESLNPFRTADSLLRSTPRGIDLNSDFRPIFNWRSAALSNLQVPAECPVQVSFSVEVWPKRRPICCFCGSQGDCDRSWIKKPWYHSICQQGSYNATQVALLPLSL